MVECPCFRDIKRHHRVQLRFISAVSRPTAGYTKQLIDMLGKLKRDKGYKAAWDHESRH